MALFSKIPDKFFKQWEVIVVTPIDDFVGALKQTNRKLIWLMAALVVLESAMIYAMVRKISRPIEAVSGAINAFVLCPSAKSLSRLRASAKSTSFRGQPSCWTTHCGRSPSLSRWDWSAD